MKRKRNYAREYARRVERGIAKGLTRTAARGHGAPSAGGAGSTSAFVDPAGKLERALKSVKRGMALRQAAGEQRVAPERLRRYLAQQTTVTRRGGRLVIDDPRPRRFPVYSEGALKAPVLSPAEATKASNYMHDVNRLLNSGDDGPLLRRQGEGVTDIAGAFVPFETDANALFRLDAAGELYFPEFYKITSGEAAHG